jgi:hypothetical protein
VPVQFDAKSSVTSGGISVTGFTDSTLTIAANPNRVLIYSLGFQSTPFPTGISLVWDQTGANQPLSLIVQEFNTLPNAGDSILIQLWALIAPVSGNKTLTATWTGSVDAKAVGASFYNVNQTGGITTFNFTNTTNGDQSTPGSISIICPTTTNDAVIAVSAATGSGFYGSPSPVVVNLDTTGFFNFLTQYELNSTSPASFTVNQNNSSHFAYAATNIAGIGPAPPGTVTVHHEQLLSAMFGGLSGSGSVSVPGLKVGDKLIWLQSPQGGPAQVGGFEIIISVNNQIQQLSASDLSAHTFNAIFARGV